LVNRKKSVSYRWLSDEAEREKQSQQITGTDRDLVSPTQQKAGQRPPEAMLK